MNQHQEKPAQPALAHFRSLSWFTPALLAIGIIAACGDDGPGFTSAPEGSFLPPELPSGWIDNKIQYASRDMVAAANPLAVNAGVAVLARGGTAVDAAIAVQMVLNLVEPQSLGRGRGRVHGAISTRPPIRSRPTTDARPRRPPPRPISS
jgi:hypothetical protein